MSEETNKWSIVINAFYETPFGVVCTNGCESRTTTSVDSSTKLEHQHVTNPGSECSIESLKNKHDETKKVDSTIIQWYKIRKTTQFKNYYENGSTYINDTKHWKRLDIVDFPESADKSLPYSFDLHFDIKRMSQLRHALGTNDWYFSKDELLDMMKSHDIKFQKRDKHWKKKRDEAEELAQINAIGSLGKRKYTKIADECISLIKLSHHECEFHGFYNVSSESRDNGCPECLLEKTQVIYEIRH